VSKAAAPNSASAESASAESATAATTITPVDPALLALRPRPEPSPEALAAITAAAQLLWPQPAVPDAQNPVHDAWRFSGRWWAQPITMRRSRPWARP
jgi:hypothetical protein